MLRPGRKKSVALQCYMLLLLPITGFLVFNAYPLLWCLWRSFYRTDCFSSVGKFIGTENFAAIFTKDFTYWKSWLNTIVFAAVKVPLELICAMLTAAVMNKKITSCAFFRSVCCLPSVVSAVVAGLIFSNMFGYFGAVNGFLNYLGIMPVQWFETAVGAYAVLIFAAIWNTFGLNIMCCLAAFASIPEEICATAKIDGATGAKLFFYVTLPMSAHMLCTIVFLNLIDALALNELVISLTGGAPGGRTLSVMAYMTTTFLPGFSCPGAESVGYGYAMSICTTFIFAALALIYFAVLKRAAKKERW